MILIIRADEVKWAIRRPSRFAMSEDVYRYKSEVEQQALNFLNEKVKHNYLNPTKGLSLDLTLGEAEILISANKEARDFADSGELAKVYEQCVALEQSIEGDYLAVRNHIGKILAQIEEKENDLIDKLTEMGIDKLRKHSRTADGVSLFDAIGLAQGDPSFNNLIVVEAAVMHCEEQGMNVDELKRIQKKLHAYIGVQAKYYEIKADIRNEYVRKVAKGDVVAQNELRTIINHRDHYRASF